MYPAVSGFFLDTEFCLHPWTRNLYVNWSSLLRRASFRFASSINAMICYSNFQRTFVACVCSTLVIDLQLADQKARSIPWEVNKVCVKEESICECWLELWTSRRTRVRIAVPTWQVSFRKPSNHDELSQQHHPSSPREHSYRLLSNLLMLTQRDQSYYGNVKKRNEMKSYRQQQWRYSRIGWA